MGKTIAIIGGLIILVGLFLGLLVPAMGLWYGAINNSPDWLFQGAWTPLGEFVVTADNTTQNLGALLLPQVCGYAMIIGGFIILLGGLAGSRKFAGVGIIACIFGLVVFALTLQGTLDSPNFYTYTYTIFGIPLPGNFTPYDPDFSIYTTLNVKVTYFLIFNVLRTQMLGGAYWMTTIGAVISLIGLSGLKK